jgi:hypothetical protein
MSAFRKSNSHLLLSFVVPPKSKQETTPVETVGDESNSDSEEEEYEEVSRPRAGGQAKVRNQMRPIKQSQSVRFAH